MVLSEVTLNLNTRQAAKKFRIVAEGLEKIKKNLLEMAKALEETESTDGPAQAQEKTETKND